MKAEVVYHELLCGLDALEKMFCVGYCHFILKNCRKLGFPVSDTTDAASSLHPEKPGADGKKLLARSHGPSII